MSPIFGSGSGSALEGAKRKERRVIRTRKKKAAAAVVGLRQRKRWPIFSGWGRRNGEETVSGVRVREFVVFDGAK